MKVHVAYGYGLFTGGLGAHYGAERLGCTVIPMSGGQTERQVQLILDFEPDIIMVTPSYMLAMPTSSRAVLDPRSTSLKIGIFGAEPWTEAMRARDRGSVRHRRDRHLRPVRSDGTWRRTGMHGDQGRSDDLGRPFLSRRSWIPRPAKCSPDGSRGELVFTSLTKEAMPVIRYRTRDLTRLLPGSIAPMRRMAKVTGRSDDMLIVRGVNVFPTQIEEQVLRCAGLSAHYKSMSKGVIAWTRSRCSWKLRRTSPLRSASSQEPNSGGTLRI